MTNNQIAFLNVMELRRANLAREGETNRHNVESESIDWFTAHEGKRHNLMSERSVFQEIAERSRHNREMEGISKRELAETHRHNSVSEGLNSWSVAVQEMRNRWEHQRGLMQIRQRDNLSMLERRNADKQHVERLSEQERHNRAVERQAGKDTRANIFTRLISVSSQLVRR